MSRFLTFRSFWKVANTVVNSPKQSWPEADKYGTIVRVSLRLPQYRLYRDYTFPTRGNASFSLYNNTKNFYRSNCSRSFGVIPARSAVRHRAQLVWKRLSERFSYSGRGFSHINNFAQAFSLAVTRSNLLLPGIFAFTSGKLVWSQRSLAETEYHPPSNTLYMRAQDGHAFMTSFAFAVLEGTILVLRAVTLGILFTPSIVMAAFADCFGPEFRKLWLHVVLRTLELAGPAFIKWGQWAATRPDLFPRDLCTKLSELHTKAPEHSFAYTKKTIERAFGRKLPEIFDNFEEKPVASGSIAQVHRATLRFRYPGQRAKPIVVAVKVRHPGVGESIRRDFVIINLVAKISKFIPALKWWRLDESVQQFAVFMMSQVDLAREAAHLSRFIYNFRRWKDVSFPKPLYPLVHPAVLVETYEQGECVSHYVDDLEGHERIKSALAHIGTHALLKMLLVDNFIHADMHPGNILVRVPKNKSSRNRLFKSKPHVIFLDVGMTAELSKHDRVNLVEFFKAVARRDGRTAAECTLRLSKQQKCPNPKAFIEEVEESFAFWGTPEGDLVHPAECMQQLLEKVRRHRVNVDGNVCTVMVTTLVLEGWQRKLDPAYNVMDTLQTLLLKADWAKSLSYTIEGLMAP
ncbi:probable serine/threonine-protein kinase abkC [Pyrus x bretschneideri]|uniref:probable serine/threonine-protein kinase abkC n=1 Tax=Pyrus x bretschneideri TaxID=225117 RepID=UPI0005112A87|nr:probable serine/threonine-protein kinase abkC [Pyrus x bretschneideri]XP_048438323.1 probable serine/threonine-protein kinase abkC [Pyrus x bretschneideri]